MTRAELDTLKPGDSLIGIAGDDECEVVEVERNRSRVYARIRYSGMTTLCVPLRAGGPEIRGARHA
ncbi:hypothetical protein [Dokdonella soli]|uniref:Uncharacterized protein n=1 Tax=Dokdonella soli TaxID=529810 RepID=A0ABP3U293_9GAMM